MMKYNQWKSFLFVLWALVLFSCDDSKESEYEDEKENTEEIKEKEQGEGLADWTTETHTDQLGVGYATVFPQDRVNRIDIVLSAEEYASMRQI